MSTIITHRQFPNYHKYEMELAGRPLTLEVGKLADICVLDRDVFDLDYRDARDLAVDMTMSDGQIVFDRNKEA